ncbi:MAG: hypothetical protein QFB87_03125 [Patescibacteria group bacterium]|nr:hypothetical protein [Patescibacteria group bacterium]
MTRFLSESLQAPEPFFRLHLRGLERAHGNPSADIKLTSAINASLQAKLQQLGLDPHDTTPQELYLALNSKLQADEAKLIKGLRTRAATHISAEADVVAGMAHALERLPIKTNCYALKPVTFKQLIKAQPPKKVMKQLGYRSIDSMLKQEPMAAIMAAAVIAESPSWQRHLFDRYKKLTPSNFETRQLAIVHPNSRRWLSLSANSVARQKHNLLAFPELGAIVLLPLPAAAPVGAVTASLALALHALNEVRASGTYLKLCQVRPDFGTIVQSIATSEPQLQAQLLDKQVSWQVIQRYYARLQQHFREDLFEPHIQLDDLAWHGVEQAMSFIEPSLHFWQHSSHIGMLHNQKAVSLNIIDTALNVCNKLPFEQRVHSYFQKSLWHELQLQYLQPHIVEQTVLSALQPQLTYAPAMA